MNKKFLAALLAVLMVFSMLPLAAGAAEGDEAEPAVVELRKSSANENNQIQLEPGKSHKLMEDITGVNFIGRWGAVAEDAGEMVLDLNGHTITAQPNGYAAIYLATGSLRIVDNSTEKGGKLIGVAQDTPYGAVEIAGSGKKALYIGADVEVVAPAGQYGITVSGAADQKENQATIELNGCKLSGAGSGIAVNGYVTEGKAPIIKLDNVTVDVEQHGMYLAGKAETAVVNSEVKGGDVGIEIRAGKLDVQGESTTIKGGSGSATIGTNGNGSAASNSAIAVPQHTTNQPIEVTVGEGVTLEATAALNVARNEEHADENVQPITVAVSGATLSGDVINTVPQGEAEKDGVSLENITVTKENTAIKGNVAFDPSTVTGTGKDSIKVEAVAPAAGQISVQLYNNAGTELYKQILVKEDSSEEIDLSAPAGLLGANQEFKGWTKTLEGQTADITGTSATLAQIKDVVTPTPTPTPSPSPAPGGDSSDGSSSDGSSSGDSSTPSETPDSGDGETSDSGTTSTPAAGEETEGSGETKTVNEDAEPSVEEDNVIKLYAVIETKTPVRPPVGPGSSGGSSSSNGSVSVTKPANGSMTSNVSSAKEGDKVTVTVKPDAPYYIVTGVTAKGESGTIRATKNADGTYSFTMPKGSVTVNATISHIYNLFKDVPTEIAEYGTAIKWAVEKGITLGTDTVAYSTFSPYNPCTRAQMVVFLYRAAGSPAVSGSNNFTDVPSDAEIQKAVQWAVSKGITLGTSDTTFDPYGPCTRGQMVTFLHRSHSEPAATGSNNFADVPADAFYKDAVQWAVNEGITKGTGDNTFAPNDACLRVQMVTFLYRDMGK